MSAVFATARTVVRPWRPGEAERLLDIRRRPEIARWLSDPTPWTRLTTATDEIEKWSARDEGSADTGGGLGVWAIVPTATGVPAGTISLNRLPGDDEVEIGWYLHPDSTGRGLASEAARGALAHGFAHGLPRIWAIMWPQNNASASVCRAIGMADLGVVDDRWYGSEAYPQSRMFRAAPDDQRAADDRRGAPGHPTS